MTDEFDKFILSVGEKIKIARNSQGMTQQNLEDGEYGIPLRTIQDIETGKSNATLKSIFKIAKKLKMHPKELLDVKLKK